MSPRTIGLLAFLATVVALNFLGARRDRLSRAPFEVTAPDKFEPMDRKAAAIMLTEEDAKASALAQGGAVYVHFGESEEDKKYTEVIELNEDDYPLRPGEETRKALYAKGVVEIGPTPLKVLDSRVVHLGANDVIAARLEADVEGKPVHLFRYVLPTDRGRGVIDAYCLASEEALYRPRFDAMVAGARGVAYRPEKLPVALVALIGALVGALGFVLAMRLRTPEAAPPRAPAPPAKAEDD